MGDDGEWVYFIDRLDCDVGRGMLIYYNKPYPRDLTDVEWLYEDFVHVFDESGAIYSLSVRLMDPEDISTIFSNN